MCKTMDYVLKRGIYQNIFGIYPIHRNRRTTELTVSPRVQSRATMPYTVRGPRSGSLADRRAYHNRYRKTPRVFVKRPTPVVLPNIIVRNGSPRENAMEDEILEFAKLFPEGVNFPGQHSEHYVFLEDEFVYGPNSVYGKFQWRIGCPPIDKTYGRRKYKTLTPFLTLYVELVRRHQEDYPHYTSYFLAIQKGDEVDPLQNFEQKELECLWIEYCYAMLKFEEATGLPVEYIDGPAYGIFEPTRKPFPKATLRCLGNPELTKLYTQKTRSEKLWAKLFPHSDDEGDDDVSEAEPSGDNSEYLLFFPPTGESRASHQVEQAPPPRKIEKEHYWPRDIGVLFKTV